MKKKKKTNPQLIFSNHVLLPSHKKIAPQPCAMPKISKRKIIRIE